MREKLAKFFSLLLFIVLVSSIVYLVFFSNKKADKGEIKMVEITGTHLLQGKEYLAYAGLNDPSKLEGVTLPVVKERLEKHPYVENADVEYLGNGRVMVYVSEKKIEAVLLLGSEPLFISKAFQLLPVLPGTKFSEVPVVSNLNISKTAEPLTEFKSEQVVEAFKIIDAAKLTNPDIFKRLSEINMRHGGDIMLIFSGIKPPVLFGRGETARKMVYLDVMWKGLIDGSSLAESSEYIDLRFSNEIYIGSTEKTGLSE